MKPGKWWTLYAPLVVTSIFPATALADDCSYTSPTDCYAQLLIALIVIAAIALLVAIGWEVIFGAGLLDFLLGETAAASGEGAALDLAAAAQRLIAEVGRDMFGDNPNAAFELMERLSQSEEGRDVLRAGARAILIVLKNPPPEFIPEAVGPLLTMLEWFQRFANWGENGAF